MASNNERGSDAQCRVFNPQEEIASLRQQLDALADRVKRLEPLDGSVSGNMPPVLQPSVGIPTAAAPAPDFRSIVHIPTVWVVPQPSQIEQLVNAYFAPKLEAAQRWPVNELLGCPAVNDIHTYVMTGLYRKSVNLGYINHNDLFVVLNIPESKVTLIIPVGKCYSVVQQAMPHSSPFSTLTTYPGANVFSMYEKPALVEFHRLLTERFGVVPDVAEREVTSQEAIDIVHMRLRAMLPDLPNRQTGAVGNLQYRGVGTDLFHFNWMGETVLSGPPGEGMPPRLDVTTPDGLVAWDHLHAVERTRLLYCIEEDLEDPFAPQ